MSQNICTSLRLQQALTAVAVNRASSDVVLEDYLAFTFDSNPGTAFLARIERLGARNSFRRSSYSRSPAVGIDDAIAPRSLSPVMFVESTNQRPRGGALGALAA